MRLCLSIPADHDRYSEDYLENTELKRSIFLSLCSADQWKPGRWQSLHLLKKCIRLLRIKNLITSHDSNQIFRIRQIDDIMSPAGNHIDCFDLIPAYFKFHRLSGVNISLLDQTVSVNNNKLLPFGVMPMLALSNSWFTSSADHSLASDTSYVYLQQLKTHFWWSG